ncbi:hypothetical protein [Aeoliella mucimassa]|nr:hypothetical protein [Aeoliella mucimassa]
MRYRPFRGNWFPRSLFRKWRNLHLVTDVIVCIVDHFEPTRRNGEEAAAASVRDWCTDYAQQVNGIYDSHGRLPQHTWFYRAEYPNLGCIKELSRYCYDGYGELEFHLHHGHDNHDSFSKKLADGLEFFNSYGAMLTAEDTPQQRFAYIAGNWSLDNGSGDPSKSGCNTEISALRDAGCYCDFTFPAIGSKAQPRMSNSIYYATDTPSPKSYDLGTAVEVGKDPSGDLMIFQGPCGFNHRTVWFEDAAVESYSPISRERLNAWASPHVHVQGRPEWLFIKLHCHGMQSKELWCKPQVRQMFEWMKEEWHTDNRRLHFVNAREAYNIAKAAEAGKQGDPADYVNFEIAQPANRLIHCQSPWQLLQFSNTQLKLSLDSGPATTLMAGNLVLQFHDHSPRPRMVEMQLSHNEVVTIRVDSRAGALHTHDGTYQHLEPGVIHTIDTPTTWK